MDKTYRVDHVGFIVRDVEKSAEMLSDYLGIKDWTIQSYEPPTLYDQRLHGQQVDHSYKIAMGSLNGVGIELLMPLKGESVYSEVLREAKGSIHHICLAFLSEEELEKKKQELISKGGKEIQAGKIKKPRGRGLYFYVEKEGVVLELTVRKQ